MTTASNINPSVLLGGINYQQSQFTITKTDLGDSVYEWADSEVASFSSLYLAKTLRMLEEEDPVAKDSYYLKAIKQELKHRGQYEASKEWVL